MHSNQMVPVEQCFSILASAVRPSLCTVGYLAMFLASTHQMPVVPLFLQQPKMCLGIANCPLGGSLYPPLPPSPPLRTSALGVCLPVQSAAPSGGRDNYSITQSLVCVSAHMVPKNVEHLGYSPLILGVLQLCSDAISRETTKYLSVVGLMILVCFLGLE